MVRRNSDGNSQNVEKKDNPLCRVILLFVKRWCDWFETVKFILSIFNPVQLPNYRKTLVILYVLTTPNDHNMSIQHYPSIPTNQLY